MSTTKKFDATLKDLIDISPEEWAKFLAHSLKINATQFEVVNPDPKQFDVLDTDVSASLQTDKLFRVGPISRRLIHLELEASGKLGLPQRLHTYNVLAYRHHKLIVHSVVILLRRQGNPSDVNGEYIVRDDSIPLPEAGQTDEGIIHYFRYHVIRLWEISLEDLLPFGVTLLPLALLTKDAKDDLEKTYERVEEQLRKSDLDDKMKSDLATMTLNLAGLTHNEEALRNLYMSVGNILEESWVYQDILQKGVDKGHTKGREEGREEGKIEGKTEALVEAILRWATKRLGSPSDANQSQLTAITDSARLERMLDETLTATSWDELLNS